MDLLPFRSVAYRMTRNSLTNRVLVYSQTVQRCEQLPLSLDLADSRCSPLENLDPERNLDLWEYILYIMTASFFIEGELHTSVIQ